MQHPYWTSTTAPHFSTPPTLYPDSGTLSPSTIHTGLFPSTQDHTRLDTGRIVDPWEYSTLIDTGAHLFSNSELIIDHYLLPSAYDHGKLPYLSPVSPNIASTYPPQVYFSTDYSFVQPQQLQQLQQPAQFVPPPDPVEYPLPQAPALDRVLFSEEWSEQGLRDHAAFESLSVNMPLRRRNGGAGGGTSRSGSVSSDHHVVHTDSSRSLGSTSDDITSESSQDSGTAASLTDGAENPAVHFARQSRPQPPPRLTTDFQMVNFASSSSAVSAVSAASESSGQGYASASSAASSNARPSPMSTDSPTTHTSHTHSHMHFSPSTSTQPHYQSRHAKLTRGKFRHEEYPRPPRPAREAERVWDMAAGLSTFPVNPNISFVRTPSGPSKMSPAGASGLQGTILNGPSYYNPHGRDSRPRSPIPPPDAPTPVRARAAPPTPSTSHHPDFPRPNSPEHRLYETYSITPAALDTQFRLAGETTVTGGRKAWICPRCDKCVRKQDRASHILGHEGKKRYELGGALAALKMLTAIFASKRPVCVAKAKWADMEEAATVQVVCSKSSRAEARYSGALRSIDHGASPPSLPIAHSPPPLPHIARPPSRLSIICLYRQRPWSISYRP
ncbi:hypothetical protein BU17DRAFT_95272 [Hysterangium stoloniferum]|nr:hypothetical protein BU17DRAFT_95272 [Hysterangium stoloniferum]